MADLTPFATVEELEAYWRTLTTAEQTRATALLLIASNRLRLIASNSDVDLDAKIAANEAYESILQWVVMEAAKRAMQMPSDQPPVESWSQTAGPYSENYKYANPTGDLWFRKAELAALGLSGRQTLGSIAPKVARDNFYS
jgi:hypothetical protein